MCPLDGYELLLFSLSGADGKTYPLCPFCYNHPPFEGVLKVGASRSTARWPSCGHHSSRPRRSLLASLSDPSPFTVFPLLSPG